MQIPEEFVVKVKVCCWICEHYHHICSVRFDSHCDLDDTPVTLPRDNVCDRFEPSHQLEPPAPGYSWATQEEEAQRWEWFFEQLQTVQETELNRILNQIADVVAERGLRLTVELSEEEIKSLSEAIESARKKGTKKYSLLGDD